MLKVRLEPTSKAYTNLTFFSTSTKALISTTFALVMYVWSLYHNGFIDKDDLKKDVTKVNKKD